MSRVVAVIAVLSLGLACDSGSPAVGPDEDARFVPADAGPAVDPDDAAAAGGPPELPVRDAAPYERPPPVAMVAEHGWAWNHLGVTPPESGGMRFATNDRLLVRAGGAGLRGASDGAGLVTTRLMGDGEIVARVRSLQMVSAQAMAGVVIRADDSMPGAPSAFLGILAEEARGGQVIIRRSAGAAAEPLPTDPQIRAAQFLRIRREGRRFTFYRSVDRLAWVRLGTAEIDMPPAVVAGVAVTAGRVGDVPGADGGTMPATTTAELDLLRVIQLDPAAMASGFDLEPMSGNGAIARIAGGAVDITAGGDQLITTSEPAIGLYAATSGSQTITAKVESVGGPMAPRARIGLTFREGGFGRVSPLARHALLSIDAAGALAFQKRDRSTNFDPGPVIPGVKLPVWLRLARWDDPQALRTRVLGSYSVDGVTFTPLPVVELALADPVLTGIIFTSGDPRVHGSARLGEFAISPTTTPIAPPADAGTADAARPDAGGGS